VTASTWTLKGTLMIACNCDYGCPCNVNGRPTAGKCEGGWTWHIESGSYGTTALDGLNFSIFADWPGAIHEGGGQAIRLRRRGRCPPPGDLDPGRVVAPSV